MSNLSLYLSLVAMVALAPNMSYEGRQKVALSAIVLQIIVLVVGGYANYARQ